MGTIREWIKLVEGRDAPLYHGTSVFTAGKIVAENTIAAKTYHETPSKDSKNLAPKREWGVSLTRDIRVARIFGPVVFELDQRKLSQVFEIRPIDYWYKENMIMPRRMRDRAEAEEFLMGPLSSLDKYLISIHVAEKDASIFSGDASIMAKVIVHPNGYNWDTYHTRPALT